VIGVDWSSGWVEANLRNGWPTIHADTKTELSGGTRLDIDRDALRMFAHKPILGWGLGTFPNVYPQFAAFHTNFFINEAHNDYCNCWSRWGASAAAPCSGCCGRSIGMESES